MVYTGTLGRLYRPTDSGYWALIDDVSNKVYHPVWKGWRLEITTSFSGHAAVLFYPFGARS